MVDQLRLEKEQRERDELLDAAVFELNQKINLTTADMSDEKANALTDLLRVQFMDIVHELEQLRMSRDANELALQSERVRQWLNSLNRSSFVPLSFRIKHLKQIEVYLEVVAQDMPSLLMRAYKVGVLHIKDKACQNHRLYQEMVHVIGVAIELAVRNVLRGFALHLPPSVLDVRQTFDMARMGLVIARTLDPVEVKDDIDRLKQAFIQHELLRRMDMFSLTEREQQIISKRLRDFIRHAEVEFSRAGENPSHLGSGPYLVSRMDYPHMKPRRSGQLSDVLPINAFLIHAGAMFRKAAEAVDASSATFQIKLDIPELCLEDDARASSLCGAMLLRTFKTLERPERQNLNEARLSVPMRPALIRAEGMCAPSPEDAYHDWAVVNLSQYGVMLESMNPPYSVSSLIEIKLSSTLRYGLVRWYRSSLQGHIQCGIEFTTAEMIPAKVTLLNFSTSDSHDKYWLALLEKVPSGWNVWLGDWRGIPVPMTVAIKREYKARTICRMIPTGESGTNYAIFYITQVMTDNETRSITDLEQANRLGKPSSQVWDGD